MRLLFSNILQCESFFFHFDFSISNVILIVIKVSKEHMYAMLLVLNYINPMYGWLSADVVLDNIDACYFKQCPVYVSSSLLMAERTAYCGRRDVVCRAS